MNVAQAEAIAKTVPGLKHVVLWRGLISLDRDIPDRDIDLLALRNRLLVRKVFILLCNICCLKPCAKFTAGLFFSLPNNPMIWHSLRRLSRSGPTFWQRYTSFWLTSLLNRLVFFVIPVVAMLIPIIGFAPRFYRWLHVRRIDQLHRALGNLERELAHGADRCRLVEYQAQINEIESAVRLLKVARPFEVDLQRLRIHLRMVQEEVSRMSALPADALCHRG